MLLKFGSSTATTWEKEIEIGCVTRGCHRGWEDGELTLVELIVLGLVGSHVVNVFSQKTFDVRWSSLGQWGGIVDQELDWTRSMGRGHRCEGQGSCTIEVKMKKASR